MKKSIFLIIILFFSFNSSNIAQAYKSPGFTKLQRQQLQVDIDSVKNEIDRMYTRIITDLENKNIELNKDFSIRLAEMDSINTLTLKRMADLSKDLNNQIEKNKNSAIEIIGLFAAIMGLIIISIGTIKYAKTIHGALLLIIGMALVMGFFASLIHVFFRTDPNYIPLIITGILLIGLFVFGMFNLDKKV